MNSLKRQEDRTLKDELPKSIGAQYASGDQWRDNSRKNEEHELFGEDWMHSVSWLHFLSMHISQG